IKTQVFDTDYTTLRAESTKEEGWVYQQLFERRFGIKELWALRKKFKAEGKDDAAMNAEIKRRLIEDASPDRVALNVLAEKRSQGIYDYLVQAGLDANRLSKGAMREVQSSFGVVPLEFVLTVHEVSEVQE